MIRNGLRFWRSTYDGLDEAAPESVLIYAPARPFHVDGIRYRMDPDRYCVRPMIELLSEGDFCTGHRQWSGNPPTDAELHHWTATGTEPM